MSSYGHGQFAVRQIGFPHKGDMCLESLLVEDEVTGAQFVSNRCGQFGECALFRKPLPERCRASFAEAAKWAERDFERFVLLTGDVDCASSGVDAIGFNLAQEGKR